MPRGSWRVLPLDSHPSPRTHGCDGAIPSPAMAVRNLSPLGTSERGPPRCFTSVAMSTASSPAATCCSRVAAKMSLSGPRGVEDRWSSLRGGSTSWPGWRPSAVVCIVSQGTSNHSAAADDAMRRDEGSGSGIASRPGESWRFGLTFSDVRRGGPGLTVHLTVNPAGQGKTRPDPGGAFPQVRGGFCYIGGRPRTARSWSTRKRSQVRLLHAPPL